MLDELVFILLRLLRRLTRSRRRNPLVIVAEVPARWAKLLSRVSLCCEQIIG
jgi:hypothetical protein